MDEHDGYVDPMHEHPPLQQNLLSALEELGKAHIRAWLSCSWRDKDVDFSVLWEALRDAEYAVSHAQYWANALEQESR